MIKCHEPLNPSSEEFLDYLSWGMLDLSRHSSRELADKIQQCCDESFMDGDTEGFSRGEKESDEYHADEYSKLESKYERLQDEHLAFVKSSGNLEQELGELQGNLDAMREHKDEAERCLEVVRRDYLELKADLESCIRSAAVLRDF